MLTNGIVQVQQWCAHFSDQQYCCHFLLSLLLCYLLCYWFQRRIKLRHLRIKMRSSLSTCQIEKIVMMRMRITSVLILKSSTNPLLLPLRLKPKLNPHLVWKLMLERLFSKYIHFHLQSSAIVLTYQFSRCERRLDSIRRWNFWRVTMSWRNICSLRKHNSKQSLTCCRNGMHELFRALSIWHLSMARPSLKHLKMPQLLKCLLKNGAISWFEVGYVCSLERGSCHLEHATLFLQCLIQLLIFKCKHCYNSAKAGRNLFRQVFKTVMSLLFSGIETRDWRHSKEVE